MTVDRVREIAISLIGDAAGDWCKNDEDNARNAFYISGICALCEAICEAIEVHEGGN